MDLSTGMLLLYVSKEYSITFSPDVKAAIFQSFILDTSKETMISPKYEKLKEEFRDYIELVLKNTIYLYLTMIKKFTYTVFCFSASVSLLLVNYEYFCKIEKNSLLEFRHLLTMKGYLSLRHCRSLRTIECNTCACS